MTLPENTHKHPESQAPPTETEVMLTSPNVMTSGEEVGGALEKLVGFSETHSTSSQQTHLDEIPYVLQSLGSTNTLSAKTPEHCTHTPSNADHRLDSRSTHDTHTPIAVKPRLEKTEPLAESTSLVSTDAVGESHPTDSNLTQTLCSSTHSPPDFKWCVLHFICIFHTKEKINTHLFFLQLK